MPWCPVCKNEYKEGYTHCNDCDVDLVESYEEMQKPIMFGQEDELEKMQQLLFERGIEGSFIAFMEQDKCFELFVRPQDLEDAKEYLQNYLEMAAKREIGEELGLSEEELESVTRDELEETVMQRAAEDAANQMDEERAVYVDKKVKAEDYKSSASALLSVGGIGLFVLVLHAFGVIPIPINPTTKYMIYGVMGAMFIAFLAAGVLALKSSEKLAKEDVEEKKFLEEAEAFLETITPERLEEAVSFEADTLEEMKYFKRMEYLKAVLTEKYPDIDKVLCDKLSEDYYDKNFGTAYDTTEADEIV